MKFLLNMSFIHSHQKHLLTAKGVHTFWLILFMINPVYSWLKAARKDSYKQTSDKFSSVQSLSLVRLFVTPWTAARQASLSIINSQNLLKLMSIELVMPPTISSSVVPFSSCLQSFPASGSFQMSQFFPSGGQAIGVPASASVLPKNIQDWFPLGWTGWISLQSKGLF